MNKTTSMITSIVVAIIAIVAVSLAAIFYMKYNSLKNSVNQAFGNRTIQIETMVQNNVTKKLEKKFDKIYKTSESEITLTDLMQDYPKNFSLKKGPIGSYVDVIGGYEPNPKKSFWELTSTSYLKHFPASRSPDPKSRKDAISQGSSLVMLMYNEIFIFVETEYTG